MNADQSEKLMDDVFAIVQRIEHCSRSQAESIVLGCVHRYSCRLNYVCEPDTDDVVSFAMWNEHPETCVIRMIATKPGYRSCGFASGLLDDLKQDMAGKLLMYRDLDTPKSVDGFLLLHGFGLIAESGDGWRSYVRDAEFVGVSS